MRVRRSPTSKSDNTPSTPTLPKSLPHEWNQANEPAADRKSIIKEFKEAMGRGDERAALRAEAKYRRIDVKAEKNIYDYGPNDPDPTIDYYFEPLNPEEQAKFDKEDRREHGLTEKEIADFSGNPTQKGQFKPSQEARRYRRRPQHPHPPQPTRRQAQKSLPSAAPNLKVPSPSGERARVRARIKSLPPRRGKSLPPAKAGLGWG